MSSTLDQKLRHILKSSNSTTEPLVKEASAPTYSTEVSTNLVKIATLVRSVRVEPTYNDLYNFVGALYGHQ
jgi:hypothetical protein